MIGAALAIDALERPWRGRRGRPESAGAAGEGRDEPCAGSPQFLWASIAALALISRARQVRPAFGRRPSWPWRLRARRPWRGRPVVGGSPGRRPACASSQALGGGVGRGEACSSARGEGAGPRGLQRGGARRISTPGGAAPPRGRRGPRRDGRRADRAAWSGRSAWPDAARTEETSGLAAPVP